MAIEALHPVLVIGEIGVQDLDRDDPATKGRVPCLVHRPKPAMAQPLNKLEITEPSLGRVCLGQFSSGPHFGGTGEINPVARQRPQILGMILIQVASVRTSGLMVTDHSVCADH